MAKQTSQRRLVQLLQHQIAEHGGRNACAGLLDLHPNTLRAIEEAGLDYVPTGQVVGTFIQAALITQKEVFESVLADETDRARERLSSSGSGGPLPLAFQRAAWLRAAQYALGLGGTALVDELINFADANPQWREDFVGANKTALRTSFLHTILDAQKWFHPDAHDDNKQHRRVAALIAFFRDRGYEIPEEFCAPVLVFPRPEWTPEGDRLAQIWRHLCSGGSVVLVDADGLEVNSVSLSGE